MMMNTIIMLLEMHPSTHLFAFLARSLGLPRLHSKLTLSSNLAHFLDLRRL
jgi:hypothetical protein